MTDDRDALRSYELEPRDDSPPPQVRCPRCRRSIIDPVVEKICVPCQVDRGDADG